MRLPAEIQGTREERVAQFKRDPELMGVATKLVAEVIEKAKVEAMRRRKSGVVSQQASIEGRGVTAADGALRPDAGLAGLAGDAGVGGAVPASAQRIKVALGSIKERVAERVSTAYGSLAERLRAGYRVSLERPAWSRDRLRNPFGPFASRRGSGPPGPAGPEGGQGGQSANGAAKGDAVSLGLGTQA